MPFVVGRRIAALQDVVLEAAMVSWLEELDRRDPVRRRDDLGCRGGSGRGRGGDGGAPFAGGIAGRVRLVPQWTPGLVVGALPRSYQDIVEGLADAVHPVRAHHICGALGLSTDKSKAEGFPSRLKRLIERGWLTEAQPGLFASQPAVTAGAVAPEQGGTEGSHRRAGVGSGPRPQRRRCHPFIRPKSESPMTAGCAAAATAGVRPGRSP
ncbi:hypothetical protein [Streptomyces sp. MBT53]|uniref:hypothetical protein n=1 Tax=Streptomyces sp. MBT53 TaxID=1488384 RepID=UPI0019124E39|nr:hypothetical protein [Streptomyces sp. MBT53]MBK6018710.1 hypothetical protein [Streptomyces sp. MBT53]